MENKEVKKQKILSVSVASYNLGEMIETNIKSFCESEVANEIELIITDDGSKDDTPKIIEKYAKKYPNTIKFIKKINEGPGSTVNSGIKNATGKYFRMVDGDDWVVTENLKDYIEFLKHSNSDLIISDYDVFNNNTKKVIETISCKIEPLKEFTLDEIYKLVPQQMHTLTFKTELFQNNSIVLDNCFYTDVEYVLYPMQFVKTVAYFNKTIYVYRVAQSAQSVSVPSMKKNIAQHERVLNNLLTCYKTNLKKYSLGQKEFIGKRLADMANTQITTYLWFDVSKEQKVKIKNFLKTLKNDSQEIYRIAKKSKIVKILLYSNFILYPMLSKMILKKVNL